LNSKDALPRQALDQKKRVADIVTLEKRLEGLESMLEQYHVAPPPPLRAIRLGVVPYHQREHKEEKTSQDPVNHIRVCFPFPFIRQPSAHSLPSSSSFLFFEQSKLDELENDIKRSVTFQADNRQQIL
jgi:hypothetical protein